MTRPVGRPPHGKPGEGQDAIDGLGDPTPYARSGLMVAAVSATVEAAVADGVLDNRLDRALAALAVEAARAVDVAAHRRDPYGVTTASRELREILGRLGLDPSARGGGKNDGNGDALDRFLDDLCNPEVRDTPDT